MRNLSATVSISANFIDQSNIAHTLRQGFAKVSRRDPGTARHTNLKGVIEALDEVVWPEDASEDLLIQAEIESASLQLGWWAGSPSMSV